MNGVVIVSPFGDGGSMSSSSSSSSPPPVVTAVVRFDVSAGAVIDRVHPESASVPASVLDCLPAYALPDGVHRENLDFVYFSIPPRPGPADADNDGGDAMWRPAAAGVACFRQKPSEASARGFVQESLCLMVVSPSPDQVHRIYTLLHGQLTRPARLYFERHVDVLKSLRDAAVTCLADPDVASSSPSVMQGAHFQTTLKRLLASMPDLVLTVVKALDAGARVVVYSEAPLHHLTSTVVAVSSVIESETAVMPYVPLVELNGVLRSVKHAIVGTNNRLAVQSGNGVPAAEVVWDVDKGRVRVEEGAWSEMLDLSSADRRFAALLAAEDDAFAVFQRLRRYRSTVRTLIDARTRRRSDSQTDGERDDVVSLDRALGDFNAKWAGKMYSYLPRVHIERTDDGEDEDGDVSARMHPCYDELDHLWSSVTEQTQAIGAQAQRGISMASSALSNLMGSLANTLSFEDDKQVDPFTDDDDESHRRAHQ
ncbi:AVL9/DENND6 domain-containing protein [Plasmodiophora brassicae]|uniref:AVL9/DENND6 domain-containing protein n=1 Tax=Plasmodiophora brassicae TaxID=37360 RepID=A0A0G4IWF1_PLABS|nr:hypothetical protein PBRA_001322 [Plasmodiophora brassicae]SPQ97421.1 unnamed protein product [Plasmodiophora brassicae]